MTTLGYDSDMKSGIYQIKNQLSGKRYIGSSANPQRRWKDHLRKLRRGEHPNPHLQAAFDRYGEHAFGFSMLEEAEPGNLISREQYYFDVFAPEYNIAPVAGNPMTGRHHTLEARAKMSGKYNHNYGKRPSEETCAKISAAKMGHPVSTETRRKMSIAHMGKRQSSEARAKLSAAHKGRKKSAETRARMSAARIGTHPSDETRARMSAAHLGKRLSAETRAKMSIAQKARWRKVRAPSERKGESQ